MNGQHGMTMIEALIIVLVVALVATAVGLQGLNWVRSERQRGAIYELYVQMSQARAEAVHRNRSCRLLLETGSRRLSVVDLNDPANAGDDEVISTVTLETGIEFGRPDGNPAVTLDATAGGFEAVFSRDGTLASSVGSVGLKAGDRFRRISVYAGGGIAVESWNGSGWVDGT
jgi:Tfp pilus assembly protein FimT